MPKLCALESRCIGLWTGPVPTARAQSVSERKFGAVKPGDRQRPREIKTHTPPSGARPLRLTWRIPQNTEAHRAVSDRLFGAEKVASQPARCSAVLTVSPCSFTYSLEM